MKARGQPIRCIKLTLSRTNGQLYGIGCCARLAEAVMAGYRCIKLRLSKANGQL